MSYNVDSYHTAMSRNVNHDQSDELLIGAVEKVFCNPRGPPRNIGSENLIAMENEVIVYIETVDSAY